MRFAPGRAVPRLYRLGCGADERARATDLFQFDRYQYDVIILGNVTARQMKAANPAALAAITRLVSEKGSGFLMIGGYSNFGDPKGGWKGTELQKLLPHWSRQMPTKVVPTEAGLATLFLRAAHGRYRSRQQGRVGQAHDLEGYVRLGKPKSLATVLAATPAGDDPLLVAQNYGNGRTLAFAGGWRTAG